MAGASITPTSGNCTDLYSIPYETSLTKDYEGYYYAISGDGASASRGGGHMVHQQHITNDLEYNLSNPGSPRMFISQGVDVASSNRCYSMEDPLGIPHFDSTMIDLSNPSEIFQFEKSEMPPPPYALVPDMLPHGYPDPTNYTQSPVNSFDLNMKPRLEYTYAQ